MNIKRKEPTEAEQNGIMYQIRQKYGIVCDTDGYKLGMIPQYKKGADMMVSYFEARGGIRDRVLNFGAQMIAKEYFLQRLTQKQADAMIKWSRKFLNNNVTDDLKIALDEVINKLDGRLPIRIRNAPEGLMIPVKNVLLTIETTIPGDRWFSLVTYFETKLVRIWSPMTVGTTTYYIRQAIMSGLQKSADDPEGEIDYKFVDFGSRGVGGMEVAAFAGASVLASTRATDTTVAIQAIEFAYGEPMAGGSIPATEHSTTGTHGREGEIDLIQQMFDAYAIPGGAFATVADTYDLIAFIRDLAPLFKERLIESGATWVFRPDSGDAIKTPVQVVVELEKVFGTTTNSKGYKVLNNVRAIQGDGIVPEQVTEILDELMALGYSASNMSFGMGGGLLQKNNRDTHKFALKCSAVRVNGVWEDVYKDPAVYDEDWNKLETKSFKASKSGRLELMYNSVTDEYRTMRLEEIPDDQGDWEPLLETVFEDGYMVRDMTFTEVRQNSGMIPR